MRALPLCVRFNSSAGFRQIILSLALFSLVASGAAQAASFLDIYGVVHDPIQYINPPNGPGGNHSYSGNNLEAGADLHSANLNHAYLEYADLSGAELENANLSNADLSNADLTFAFLPLAILGDANLGGADLTNALLSYAILRDANLTNADLSGAELYGTNLGGAILTGANLTDATYLGRATYLGTNSGSAYYNAETDFTNAWHLAPGGVLFDPVAAGWTFVPEPSTALLLGIGMMGLGMRRRVH